MIIKAEVVKGGSQIMSGRLNVNGMREWVTLSRGILMSRVGVDVVVDLLNSGTVSMHDSSDRRLRKKMGNDSSHWRTPATGSHAFILLNLTHSDKPGLPIPFISDPLR
jgi:hypothetical protein